MVPSELNKVIQIYKETTTINAVGTPTETYQFFKQTYAKMFVRTGGSEYAAEGTLPFTRVEFTIRYDPGVNYKCKIKYNGQYYEISHIEHIGRKHFLKIQSVVWEGELENG